MQCLGIICEENSIDCLFPRKSAFRCNYTHYTTRTVLTICTSFSVKVFSSTFVVDEFKIVVTPAFAESVSEGDIKWDKSK